MAVRSRVSGVGNCTHGGLPGLKALLAEDTRRNVHSFKRTRTGAVRAADSFREIPLRSESEDTALINNSATRKGEASDSLAVPKRRRSRVGTSAVTVASSETDVDEGGKKRSYFGRLWILLGIMMLSMESLLPVAATVGITIGALTFMWLLSYLMEFLRVLEDGNNKALRTPMLEDPTSLVTVPFPSVFDRSEKYMSLIMPAYNEELRLPSTLDETLQYLQERAKQDKSFTYEIIIVDDGSKDRTVKVAFEYVKKHKLDNVRVLKQGVNQGKGAAVRKGMLCARGQLCLMLDADGATKITDMLKLEQEIKRAMFGNTVSMTGYKSSTEISNAKLSQHPLTVFGSRAHMEKNKQAMADRKWYRSLVSKGFHLFVILVAGTGVKDTQCGFKLFTRAAARDVFLNMRLKRFSFDVEIMYLCKRMRIPIKEVAVNWTEIPGSKVKISSILHMAFELVLIRLGYGFNFWKLHHRPTFE